MKTYRLLKEDERIKLGDYIYSTHWNKCITCVGTMTGHSVIKREIVSYTDAPIAQRRVQLTAEQLDLVSDLVDVAYHKLNAPHLPKSEVTKLSDDYSDILLILDDSEEVI